MKNGLSGMWAKYALAVFSWIDIVFVGVGLIRNFETLSQRVSPWRLPYRSHGGTHRVENLEPV